MCVHTYVYMAVCTYVRTYKFMLVFVCNLCSYV